MTNHIVLFQPEIPANTGNIARTCAGTNTHLHLIKPLGFSTDDKMLKRAGLDYWEHVNITYHESIEDFFDATQGEYYLLTKFGNKRIVILIFLKKIQIIILYLEEKRLDYRIG